MSPEPKKTEIHYPTLILVGISVFTLISVGHELGHYFTARFFGAPCIALSNAHCDCDLTQFTGFQKSLVSAGGTLYNLFASALFGLWLYLWPPREGSMYYFVWLAGAANLFMGGGYLLVDPIGGFGDWTEVLTLYSLSGFQLAPFIFAGALFSFSGLFAFREALTPLLPSGDEATRKRMANLLCLLPYLLIGGVFTSAVTLLNRVDWQTFVLTNALAILGGTFFLAWLPAWIKEDQNNHQTRFIRRSVPLMALGIASAIMMLTVFGPAILFSESAP